MKKMKKILQSGLIISSLSASLYAAGTNINNLGVTPGYYPFTSIVAIQVTDDDGNPITNEHIEMIHNDNMHMYAMDLNNISEGKYVVKLRHNSNCEEGEVMYHETLQLQAYSTQLGGGDLINIPIDFDCINHEFHFETEHPYSNNTHTVTELAPEMCTGTFFVSIVGETESNYDFLTILQDGNQIAKLDGNIRQELELDCTLPTTIRFDSDYSVTKRGVSIGRPEL